MQAFLPKAKIQASGFVLAPLKTQTDRGTRPGHASYAVGPCCLHLARAGPWGGVPGWVHVLLFTHKLTHQVTFYYFFLPVRDNLQGTNTCTAECTGRTSPEALPRELLHVFQRAQCKPGTGLEHFPLHFASSITKRRGGIQPTDTPSHPCVFIDLTQRAQFCWIALNCLI